MYGGLRIAKGPWKKAVAVLRSQLLSFLQCDLGSPLLGNPFLLDLNLLCLNLPKTQRNCWTPTYSLVGEFTGLSMLGKFS